MSINHLVVSIILGLIIFILILVFWRTVTEKYEKCNTSPIPCPLDTYNPKTGQTTCTACPQGTHTNGTGKTNFTDCIVPPGSYLVDNVLNQCPAGSYCSGGSALPKPCDAGSYSSAGAEKCILASVGYSSSNNGVGSTSQIICPVGTYAYGTGNAICSTCPEGQLCNKEGLGEPLGCPVGSYCPDPKTSATPCPAGYYCPTCNIGTPP